MEASGIRLFLVHPHSAVVGNQIYLIPPLFSFGELPTNFSGGRSHSGDGHREYQL
jgi:hypothetical protein